MTWIPRRRNKPRPGRLQGAALEQLRRECFDRDGYRCQAYTSQWFPGVGTHEAKCGARVSWESGHMAHVVSRGRGGKDELSNVVTKCAECHLVREHAYGPSGVKPVPKKPDIQEAI